MWSLKGIGMTDVYTCSVRLFDTTYPAYRVFMLLTAIAMFAALLAVLARTRVGLIIQAALTHPDMVAMLGHNVPKIFMPVFGAGALAIEIR